MGQAETLGLLLRALSLRASARGATLTSSRSQHPEEHETCCEPHPDHERCAYPARGALGRIDAAAGLLEDLRWDETDQEPQPEGHEQEIVEVSEERDEVWNEVDGAGGVSEDEGAEEARGPRRARVGESQREREELALHSACPVSEAR